MKTKITFVVVLFLLLYLFGLSYKVHAPEKKSESEKIIQLGQRKMVIELADNEAKIIQGLSGRTSLAKDHGMLFVMNKKDKYVFWMKEMRFPLDFIWIDGQKVVDITENVPYPKEGQPIAQVAPKTWSDKVLEVNAGMASSSGVKIGDLIPGL